MRKPIMILGTILISTVIIICGSAVATWHFADHVEDYERCRNPDDAVGAPDTYQATLGVETPILRLGWIILDLGEGNEMGPSQDFTVFASSTYEEEYLVSVSDDPTFFTFTYLDKNTDLMPHDFTTPSTPDTSWRYIMLEGNSGGISPPGDPYYGPEINAVGWED